MEKWYYNKTHLHATNETGENNDCSSHKRFGYANRHSTMHIASNLGKTHRFGTTITSGWPNSLASLTISYFTKHYPALVITKCLQIKTWPCTIVRDASGYTCRHIFMICMFSVTVRQFLKPNCGIRKYSKTLAV